jgi:opacity protein-like surface antigen
MKLTTLYAAAVALVGLPGISQAEFNYTSVDFGYVDVDYDVGPASISGDGFGVSGTYTVADAFFIGGSYDDYGFDGGVDAEILEIGGGYFHPMNATLDFVATFSYLDAQLSYSSFSVDDDGFGIGGGVRAAVSNGFEVEAMLDYVNYDKGDSDTGIELRGRYFFSDDFAVTAQFDVGKDIETFRLGIRAQF